MAKVKQSNPGAFVVLEKALRELDGLEAKTGWFETSVYPSGTPVAYVAAIQEFGYAAGNIPPRPFMRPTIAKQQKVWRSLMLSGAKAILNGKATGAEVMEAVSFQAEGDVAKAIKELYSPPLKPKTILARARRRVKRVRGKPLVTATLQKPLVDTALMINTLTHVVEKKMIPGGNILNMAFQVIAKQSFDYYAFTGRVTTDIGTLVPTYANAVCLSGSWQPVDRNLYQVLGLDFQKNYALVYVSNAIIDVARDVSGDQFAFQGKRYQCESIAPWFGIDGWNKVLVVEVVNPNA